MRRFDWTAGTKFAAGCLIAGAIVGCGGGGEGEKGGMLKPSATPTAKTDKKGEDEPAKSAADAKAWDPALGTATITGVAKFSGDPPRRREVDMKGKPECAQLHSQAVLDESVLVGPGGGLQNVIVSVQKGLEAWTFPVPGEPVVLDQKGCTFHPHVVGVRAGQKIAIRNSDPFAHNVHSLPTRNQSFNFTQAKQGDEDLRDFAQAETELVYVKCDIHGWMNCHVGVFEHPFFAVTGADGTFTLPKLPPGEYVVLAAHESLGKKRATVKVAAGAEEKVEFSFAEE